MMVEALADWWQRANDAFVWLGIDASLQDLAKAGVLTVFVLVILVILGDVYRGEIQNTFHRVRVIAHKAKDAASNPRLREALQLPRFMVEPTLDGIYSNAHFYYRYRDHLGRLKTKPLHTYRVRLRVRATYAEATAAGQENLHKYDEEERITLAKERPDSESNRPISEIVSLAASRSDFLKEAMNSKMKDALNTWSRLERTSWRRWLAGVKANDLREPEIVGIVMKFHFPINPYFLLYKHPDTNIRSTAWLTVLTSVFALFMQIVYGSTPSAPTRIQGAQTAEIVRSIR